MTDFVQFAIGDLCKIQQGKTLLKRDMAQSGYPVFGANGQIGWSRDFHYVDEVLVIGCRGSCGSLHITLPRSFVSNNAMALLPLNSSNVDRDYLYFILKHTDLSKVITGGVQPQITRRNLESFRIPLPPFDDQQRISRIMNQAANLEHLHETAAKAASALGSSLMAHLLEESR